MDMQMLPVRQSYVALIEPLAGNPAVFLEIFLGKRPQYYLPVILPYFQKPALPVKFFAHRC